MPNQTANQTALRAGGHVLTGGLSVYIGAIAAEGEITSLLFNPATALAVSFTSGDETDVIRGARIEVYNSSGGFKGATRVRYAGSITSTSIPVRELSYGEFAVVPGDTFIVRREVRLSDKLVEADAAFSPDGIAYTDQGSNPTPIANAGGGGAWKVDAGETYATVPFFGSLSFTVDPDSGGTLTYLWVIPTGAGDFASGSSDTDDDPVMELNVGNWLIELQVTDDDNSKTTTKYIPVVVYDDANPQVEVQVENLTGTLDDGWSASCRVFSAADMDSIPDGSLVYLTVRERIGGAVQSFGSPVDSRSHIHLTGYIRRERENERDGDSELTFEIISPLARLAETPGFSKVMIREASPDAWSEIKGLKTGRAIVQLWQFYTNAGEAGFDLNIHDEYKDYDYPLLFLNTDNPRAQIAELARATDARFVCDRRGRFELQPVPSLLYSVDRDDLVTTLTLTRADGMVIEVEREHWRPVETVRIRGFTQGTSTSDVQPVFARWAGSPGHGNESDTVENLIFLNVAELLIRAGLHGAMKDGWYVDPDTGEGHFAPRVVLTLPGSYASVFDFYAEWINLNITTRRRGIDLSKFRYTLESVNITYVDGTAETEIVLQAETYGHPGVIDPQEQLDTSGITDTSGDWEPYTFDITDPLLLGASSDRVYFVLRDGTIAYTVTFASSADYSTSSLGATVHDAVQTPGIASRLEVATPTALNIYSNVPALPTLEATNNFTYAVQSGTLRTIQHERGAGNANWIPVVYWRSSGEGGGLIYEGSIDGGATLQSPVLIGDSATVNIGGGATGGGDQIHPALYVDPHTAGVAYVVARDTTFKIFKTTNFGASWSVNTDYLLASDATDISFNTIAMAMERPFLDTSFIYTVRVDTGGAAQGTSINRHTNAVANTLRNSPPFATELYYSPGVGAYAAPRLRRGLRTSDADPDLLLVINRYNRFGTGQPTDGVWISTDGTTLTGVIAEADYPSGAFYNGGVFGGGTVGSTPVYLWTNRTSSSGLSVGYVPNAYTWADSSDVINKTGSGFPTSGEILTIHGF